MDIGHGLFVYVVGDGEHRVHCLSVLPPADVATIGSLPTEAIAGHLVGGHLEASAFQSHDIFLRFLAFVVAKHARSIPDLAAQIELRQSGLIDFVDARVPAGEAPDIEDVFGAFVVDRGSLVEYRGSPKYRVIGRRGLMKLEPFVHTRLLEELKCLHRDETPPMNRGGF